jgi:ectoine hydroxylase-related dioxygenase (phytanoyl-CoA dioxygenase family)
VVTGVEDVDALEYELDCRGYAVLRELVRPGAVTALRELVAGALIDPQTGKFSFLARGRATIELAADPVILGLLEPLLGRGLRLDVAFGLRHARGGPPEGGLHGGPHSEQGVQRWESWGGRPRPGPVKVLVALTAMGGSLGGFVALPGSHRSTFPRPGWLGPDDPALDCPALGPGDALAFSDALVHGTRRWAGEADRVALVYSYCPGWAAWRDPATLGAARELAATEVERRLLRPPWVGTLDEARAAETGQWQNSLRGSVR